MQDIVFPSGNEADFIRMARLLGWSGLICVYSDKSQFSKDPFVKNALLVEPMRVNKAQDLKVFSVCRGSREAIERGASIAFDFESLEDKDKTHFKESGLNQVLCNLAREKNVKIAFSLSSILSKSGKDRAVLLGKIMQNIMLCRKFDVMAKVASFAKSPLDMRSPSDLASLFMQLGMSAKDVKSALL